jgi:hypothetical protein
LRGSWCEVITDASACEYFKVANNNLKRYFEEKEVKNTKWQKTNCFFTKRKGE